MNNKLGNIAKATSSTANKQDIANRVASSRSQALNNHNTNNKASNKTNNNNNNNNNNNTNNNNNNTNNNNNNNNNTNNNNNNANNTNNMSNANSNNQNSEDKTDKAVKAAANIAEKSSNPYAKAAGKAIKVADKLSGGKSTKSISRSIKISLIIAVITTAFYFLLTIGIISVISFPFVAVFDTLSNIFGNDENDSFNFEGTEDYSIDISENSNGNLDIFVSVDCTKNDLEYVKEKIKDDIDNANDIKRYTLTVECENQETDTMSSEETSNSE